MLQIKYTRVLQKKNKRVYLQMNMLNNRHLVILLDDSK